MTGIIATQERAGLVWGAQCWDTGRGKGAAEQGVKWMNDAVASVSF